MAGKPFKVGRFAHTLRVRLMREHVGIDVDAMDDPDLLARKPQQDANEIDPWDPDAEQAKGTEDVTLSAGHTGRMMNMAKAAGQAAGAGKF
jgi:phospholipase D1/2